MLNDSIDEYEQVAPHNEESSLQTDVYTVSDQNQLWQDVEFPGQVEADTLVSIRCSTIISI